MGMRIQVGKSWHRMWFCKLCSMPGRLPWRILVLLYGWSFVVTLLPPLPEIDQRVQGAPASNKVVLKAGQVAVLTPLPEWVDRADFSLLSAAHAQPGPPGGGGPPGLGGGGPPGLGGGGPPGLGGGSPPGQGPPGGGGGGGGGGGAGGADGAADLEGTFGVGIQSPGAPQVELVPFGGEWLSLVMVWGYGLYRLRRRR